MSGALHPALAPLLAGGGTPERVAAVAGELRDRMERLLAMPAMSFLDDGMLAPLTAPPEPGETLEAVLARLTSGQQQAGGPVERTGVGAFEGSMRRDERTARDAVRTGVPAPRPTPVEIAAHARSMPRPSVRSSWERSDLVEIQPQPPSSRSPRFDPPVAVANVEPRAENLPNPALPAAERTWQAEAARLGSHRSIRIAAVPSLGKAFAAGADQGSMDDRAASPWTAPFRVADEAAGAAQTMAEARDGSASFADLPSDMQAISPARWRRAMAPYGAASTQRPQPIASVAGDKIRSNLGTPAAGTGARPPKLGVVALPEGARVGGFAGLAALGRVAAARDTTERNPPLPDAAAKDEPSVRMRGNPPADRSPPANPQAVIAELADVLRLQMLAAGIDLKGRR